MSSKIDLIPSLKQRSMIRLHTEHTRWQPKSSRTSQASNQRRCLSSWLLIRLRTCLFHKASTTPLHRRSRSQPSSRNKQFRTWRIFQSRTPRTSSHLSLRLPTRRCLESSSCISGRVMSDLENISHCPSLRQRSMSLVHTKCTWSLTWQPKSLKRSQDCILNRLMRPPGWSTCP